MFIIINMAAKEILTVYRKKYLHELDKFETPEK